MADPTPPRPLGCVPVVDPCVAVAHAVPHRVVPQLLRRMVAATVPPDGILLNVSIGHGEDAEGSSLQRVDDATSAVVKESLRPAQQCVTRLNVKSWGVSFVDTLRYAAELPLLTHLDLSECIVDVGIVAAAAHHLPRLQELTVNAVCATFDVAAFAVLEFKQLRKLDLAGRCSKLSTADFSILRNLPPTLRSLSFGGSAKINDRVLAHIGTLVNLRELRLEICPRLNAKAFAHLKNLSQVRTLHLVGCGVDTSAIDMLRDMSALTSLNLSHNPTLDDAAVERIAQLLPMLEELDLERCTGVMSFAPLGRLMHLCKLSLLGCSLTSVGVENSEASRSAQSLSLAALGKLPALTAADFNHCPLVDNADMSALAHPSSALTELKLEGCRFMDAASFANISTIPKLRALHLSRANVDDSAAASIAKMKRLQFLDLGLTGVTGECLHNLSECVALTELNLSGTTGLSSRTLPNIARLPLLRSLTLADTDVDAAALSCLPLLPKLQDLNLTACASVNTAALAHVLAVQGIRRLTLWGEGCTLDAAGLKLLSTAPTLEALRLPAATEVTPEGFAALATLPRLKELLIHSCSAVDAAAIAQLIGSVSSDNGMPSTSSLTFLSLNYCCNVKEDVVALIGGSAGNTTDVAVPHLGKLRKLSLLGCTNVSSNAVDHLRNLPVLETLCLTWVKTDDESLLRLAALGRLSTLQAKCSPDTAALLRKHVPHVSGA